MMSLSATMFTIGLVLYTIGVWGEKVQGKLKIWHLVLFCLALGFSILSMTGMKGSALYITLIANILLIDHSVFAVMTLSGKYKLDFETFHKYSIIFWLFWFVPYCIGVFILLGKN